MTSSKTSPRPVQPPQGNAQRPANYARFIPREELAGFAAWTPDIFAGLSGVSPTGAAMEPPAPPPQERPAPPPGPTDAEWMARVQEARQLGYQDGYRDGLEALEAAKRQHLMQVSAQMAQLVAAFDDQIQALEARMGDAVTDTAVLLARQVLRADLQQHPETIAQVAREAIGAVMMSARHLHLRLHPMDLELVQTGAGDALRARDVLLLADPAITRGGCIVQSDLGQVDAAIESRWAQATAAFGRAMSLDADVALETVAAGRPAVDAPAPVAAVPVAGAAAVAAPAAAEGDAA